MQLDKFIDYVDSLDNVINTSINNSFLRESRFYLRLMKQYTPRDTGELSDNWKISKYDVSGDKKEAIISNDLDYAYPIEFGSKPKHKPWPNPGKRTMIFGGMIFSIQATGGVATNAIQDSNLNDTIEHMSNDLVKVL